jgi:hypothetical protein
MPSRPLVVVFCAFCYFCSFCYFWMLPRQAAAHGSGHGSNNSFRGNSRPSSGFQRQNSSSNNFNYNNAPRVGNNNRQNYTGGSMNYQAQQARQQAAYARQQENARLQQQEARRQQEAAQQQYRQQQELAERRAQEARQQQYRQQQELAERRAQEARQQHGQLQRVSGAGLAEQNMSRSRAQGEVEADLSLRRRLDTRRPASNTSQAKPAHPANSHPLVSASEAAQIAHEKALAARARQTQQIGTGQPAHPAGHQPGNPSSSAAQAALERARAARAKQIGQPAESRPVAGRSSERPAASTSPAAQAALERALAARAKHTPDSLSENPHIRPKLASALSTEQIKQHQQQALVYISQQKKHITSRTGFQAAQSTAISKLTPEQQAAVHAKVFHNESLMQANLRPSTQKPTLGKLQPSSLHLLPNSPGLAKLNTGQNDATKTGPTGRQTIILPNGKPFVLNYTPTGRPRVRPPHLPVATLGAANAAGQRPAGTKPNSGTNALQALAGKSGANAAVLTELIVGTVGQAILFGQGLFSGGGLSVPGGGGGGFAGEGGGFDDGSDDSGGCASAFDSGCVYVPNDDNADGGDDPDGSGNNGSGNGDASGDPTAGGGGVLLSVNSGQAGGGAGSDGDGGDSGGADGDPFNQTVHLPSGSAAPGGDGASDISPTVYDAPSTKIDAVPQTGRYLNVINLSAKPATFHVQYHAQDQNGNWAWFPQSPDMSDDGISFDLNPGQAVELWDGDWHVYADKARIWAVSTDGQQQWNRYKSTDLLLVSETDDQGQPCYFAPDIQTLSYGLK